MASGILDISITAMPFFGGATIDRADAIRSDPDALAAQRTKLSARLLRLDGIDPVLHDVGGLDWGSLADAPDDAELLFIGLADGAPRFAVLPPADAIITGKFDARSRSVWRVLPMLSHDDAAIYGGVRSVIDWHMRHRFCAVCGGHTHVAKGGWARTCGKCGAEHFPRVDPVVIMLAQHDGRVLLGRQPAFPAGRYSALAGFVEPGESIEDAVIRELHEEAGVRACNVRYIASQPWPFPSSLMVACIADVEDDALSIDTKELDDARWFSTDQVAAAMRGCADADFIAPPTFAIAHHLLAQWQLGQSPNY
jgi:NAD+ diphosphatase